MKYILTLIIASIGLHAYSCNCGKTDIKAQVKEVHTIFTGTLVKHVSNDSTNQYYFLPEKLWKGERNDTMLINFPLKEDSCQMELQLQKRYVIYSKNEFSNSCRRNALLTETRDSIYLELLFNKPFATKLGAELTHKLSEEESTFLNVIFKDKDYDFTDKKVIFFEGKFPSSKQKYFSAVRRTMNQKEQMIVLTKEERKQMKIDALVLIKNKKPDVSSSRDTYLKILKMGKY